MGDNEPHSLNLGYEEQFEAIRPTNEINIRVKNFASSPLYNPEGRPVSKEYQMPYWTMDSLKSEFKGNPTLDFLLALYEQGFARQVYEEQIGPDLNREKSNSGNELSLNLDPNLYFDHIFNQKEGAQREYVAVGRFFALIMELVPYVTLSEDMKDFILSFYRETMIEDMYPYVERFYNGEELSYFERIMLQCVLNESFRYGGTNRYGSFSSAPISSRADYRGIYPISLLENVNIRYSKGNKSDSNKCKVRKKFLDRHNLSHKVSDVSSKMKGYDYGYLSPQEVTKLIKVTFEIIEFSTDPNARQWWVPFLHLTFDENTQKFQKKIAPGQLVRTIPLFIHEFPGNAV